MTSREMDRWFEANVARAVRESWGSGWAKLSHDQQSDAILAACTRNLWSQATYDDVLDKKSGAAALLGQHAVALLQAAQRYLSKEAP